MLFLNSVLYFVYKLLILLVLWLVLIDTIASIINHFNIILITGMEVKR